MESKLVFARYFIERWAGREYVDSMLHFCNTHVKYRDIHNRFFYVIIEPRMVELDADRAVFAKLAKIRIAREAEFWDERRWRMIPVALPQPQAESHARFMAFKDNHFAFEERKPYISKAAVTRVMPQLYTIAAEEPLRVMRIELLKDTREIYEWLSDFEQVVRVRFERIRKPNPVDDVIFEKIKRHIDETKARNMSYENKEDGLNVQEGSLIDSGLKLCEEGYGDFEVEAKRQQEIAKRTSREFTLTKRIQYEDDDEFVEKTWTEKRRLRRRRRSREEES